MLLTSWLKIGGFHHPILGMVNLLEWLIELKKSGHVLFFGLL